MKVRTPLPREMFAQPMQFPEGGFDRLTHYAFRYPAKFHPPVARALVERFTASGQTVLDPFCGSGTIAVEARALGRNAIMSDIDPVAVFISRTKTLVPAIEPLRNASRALFERLSEMQRRESEYERRMFEDMTQSSFTAAVRRYELDIPNIPNINHWFRRYVIVDLARIMRAILDGGFRPIHRDIFLLSFASIIRNASNADPVPVSGLEVTSYMKRREDAGRLINPFALYRRNLDRTINDFERFTGNASQFSTTVKVLNVDATEIDSHIAGGIDAVITSPPYHNAVDYYRRHTLEMYWLGLVHDREDRLKLLPRYIGRSCVSQTHPAMQEELKGSKTALRWEALLRTHDAKRADAFKHYLVSMRLCFGALSKRIARGKPVVFVVGKSSWNGAEIPTVDLFKELSEDRFAVREVLWYPLKNRYMSYSRHNGASINREYVLVLERH